jgi:tetrahydromethanopterin S-methyltransferase subunit G
MEEPLKFRKGDRIKIEGELYQILGGIELVNRSDGARWTEYYVQNLQNGKLRWLSVDEIYDEYAIYTSCDSKGFSEEELDAQGWKNADSGVEEVLGWFGNVDAEQGEKASYTEYEDSTGEYLMSVEHWDGETEYAKGYYLDKDEIEIASDLQQVENRVDYNNCQPRHPQTMQKRKGRNNKIIALVVIAIMACGIWAMTKSASKKEIRNYLEDSSFYFYETSITSDLNEEEKADVYSTSRSIEMAAKDIINAIDGETEDVQENTEDKSVAILTEHEYCLVYESEEGKTMVQASSRAFAYQSTSNPYHATSTTARHYRSFYYFRGFSRDASRYDNRASGYQNYSGTVPDYNYSDTYRNYSNTVRQGSTGTRTSSGGGIGFGK